MFNPQQQQQMMYGTPMQYNPQQLPNFTQPLTVEQIRKMKQGATKSFSTHITEEERNQAICTHKDPDRNNEISLMENSDGSSTCYICGETFTLVNYNKDDVGSVVSSVNDILQSIKTYYLDIPEKAASDFMMIIALIKKIPQLYEIALNNFSRYDTALHSQMQGQNAFALFNSIMQPGAMMPGMYPGMQPQMGMYPQQPQMGGYPGMQPQMGMYPQQQPQMGGAPVMHNAFGGYPQQQYPQQPQQPQQQQGAGQQNVQQQQGAGGQDQRNNQPTVTKVFNV